MCTHALAPAAPPPSCLWVWMWNGGVGGWSAMCQGRVCLLFGGSLGVRRQEERQACTDYRWGCPRIGRPTDRQTDSRPNTRRRMGRRRLSFGSKGANPTHPVHPRPTGRAHSSALCHPHQRVCFRNAESGGGRIRLTCPQGTRSLALLLASRRSLFFLNFTGWGRAGVAAGRGQAQVDF